MSSPKPKFTKFCKPSEIIAFSFQRQKEWIQWLNSSEGKTWYENSKLKEYQYRRIAYEGMRCAL